MTNPTENITPATSGKKDDAPAKLDDTELKLYTLLVDQVQKYSTIVWQFPTALLAANTFAIDKFLQIPVLLAGLSAADVALVFAFYRLVQHQRTVIESARLAEDKIRLLPIGSYIPKFTPPSLRATTVTLAVLGIMTALLAFYSVGKIMQTYICCKCAI